MALAPQQQPANTQQPQQPQSQAVVPVAQAPAQKPQQAITTLNPTTQSLLEDFSRLAEAQREASTRTQQVNKEVQRSGTLLMENVQKSFQTVQEAFTNIRRNNSNPAGFNKLMALFGDETYDTESQSLRIEEARLGISLMSQNYQLLNNMADAERQAVMDRVNAAAGALQTKLTLAQEARTRRGEQRAEESHALSVMGAKINLDNAYAVQAERRISNLSDDMLAAAAADPANAPLLGFIQKEMQGRKSSVISGKSAALALESSEIALTSNKIQLADLQKNAAQAHAVEALQNMPRAQFDKIIEQAAADGGKVSIPVQGTDGQVRSIDLPADVIAKVSAVRDEASTSLFRKSVDVQTAQVGAMSAITNLLSMGSNLIRMNPNLATGTKTDQVFRQAQTLTSMADKAVQEGNQAAAAELYKQASSTYTAYEASVVKAVTETYPEKLHEAAKDFLLTGNINAANAPAVIEHGIATLVPSRNPVLADVQNQVRVALAQRLDPKIVSVDQSGQQTVNLDMLMKASQNKNTAAMISSIVTPQMKTAAVDGVIQEYMKFTLGQMAEGGLDMKDFIMKSSGVYQWNLQNVLVGGKFDVAKMLQIMAAKDMQLQAIEGGEAQASFYNTFKSIYFSREGQQAFAQQMDQEVSMTDEAMITLLFGQGSDLVSQVNTFQPDQIFTQSQAMLQKQLQQAQQKLTDVNTVTGANIPPSGINPVDIAKYGAAAAIKPLMDAAGVSAQIPDMARRQQEEALSARGFGLPGIAQP